VNQALPRTIANQFDIDTPIELSILAYAGGAGPRLTAWLEVNTMETDQIAKAAWLFTDSKATVMVAGRIGGDTMEYLRTETASQTRVYSEERGMQATGRDLSGEARSLLGFHIQAVGVTRFFVELGEMANRAFIDTRPIFAHMGLQASRPDRFLSDALRPRALRPRVRDFTAAAREASIPIVLGGQSLVTSGLQFSRGGLEATRPHGGRVQSPRPRPGPLNLAARLCLHSVLCTSVFAYAFASPAISLTCPAT
jgi:hypothetical protein